MRGREEGEGWLFMRPRIVALWAKVSLRTVPDTVTLVWMTVQQREGGVGVVERQRQGLVWEGECMRLVYCTYVCPYICNVSTLFPTMERCCPG